MIQVQCVIDFPADGRTASVRVDRLAREDANDDERAYADIFEDHFVELLREIAALFSNEGWKVETTGIGRSAPSPSAAPDEPPGAP